MTALDVLKQARKLITNPEKWTPNCPRWGTEEHCIITACSQSADTPQVYQDATNLLSKAVGGSLISFNKVHTHSEVLAVFDKAIQSLEATTQ